jgi:biotin transport system substrate-specific component
MALSLPANFLPANSLAGVALKPASGTVEAVFRNLVLAFAGSLLLIVSAKVQVPFWPVPMTMQSLAVLFIGAAYGPRLGAATVALYLAQGFAGLPVFASTVQIAGPAYFMGPTGGFLLSFIPAAYIAGVFSRRGASPLRVTAGMAIAHVLILALGFLWLAVFAQMASGATGIGFAKAFASGVQPFIVGTVVKVALATALVFGCWSLLKGRTGSEA